MKLPHLPPPTPPKAPLQGPADPEQLASPQNQAIDTVLAGLRNAAPPADFEVRLLARLQRMPATRNAPGEDATFVATTALAGEQLTPHPLLQSAASRPRTPRRTLFAARPAWLVTAAAVIIVVFLLAHRPSTPLPSPGPHPAPVSAKNSAPPRAMALASAPPVRRATTSRRLVRTHPAPSPAVPTQEAELSTSFPAPPLPLTSQEQLLLRLARRHTRDPEELAALTPATRARQQAADHAQFDAFFRPPPLLILIQPTQ